MCLVRQQRKPWEAAGALGSPREPSRPLGTAAAACCLSSSRDCLLVSFSSLHSLLAPCSLHYLLAPCSGQKATPAATGTLPIAWLATAVPAPTDGGIIATVNDRRVRLGPAGAPEEQQPSLYRLCRQWVQNDPDLPAPLADVRHCCWSACVIG